MKILVIGAGGREHALAWKLAQEADVLVCPGNPGIARTISCLSGDPVQVACEFGADLVVVGPEDPLVDGLADRLRTAGFPTFGPGAEAARLEGSKAFSKMAMTEAGIPTARARTFARDEHARAWIEELDGEVAVKASGNALGKGVVGCGKVGEALAALEQMRGLGPAGDEVVIEERISGREVSLLTLCSESGIVSLPPAQDHKRAYDGDLGPNTGGMGAFSPVPWVSEAMVSEMEAIAVRPLLAWLAARGIVYRGCLFTGFMLTSEGPKVLEYNVRFGDPETQAVMPRLGDGFAATLMACAKGEAPTPIPVSPEASCALVVASEGYPGEVAAGNSIATRDTANASLVFYAGVGGTSDDLATKGGRVATIVGRGESLVSAREVAYTSLDSIAFKGAWSRSDIGAALAP